MMSGRLLEKLRFELLALRAANYGRWWSVVTSVKPVHVRYSEGGVTKHRTGLFRVRYENRYTGSVNSMPNATTVTSVIKFCRQNYTCNPNKMMMMMILCISLI